MMGRYTFPWQIGFAANYRIQSGFPYSPHHRRRRHASPTLNLSNFEAPFFVENLNDNRSDNVSLLNFRIDKAFTVGRFKVSGMLDIYNVLNDEPVTNFTLTLGPSYKRVTAVLDPRVFMVGRAAGVLDAERLAARGWRLGLILNN